MTLSSVVSSSGPSNRIFRNCWIPAILLIAVSLASIQFIFSLVLNCNLTTIVLISIDLYSKLRKRKLKFFN